MMMEQFKKTVRATAIATACAAPLVASTAFAWFTNSTLTGLAGFGTSVLIGLGTTAGIAVCGVIGAVAGAMTGAGIDTVLSQKGRDARGEKFRAFMTRFVGFGLVGGLGGAGYGAYQSYQWSESALVKKEVTTDFNKSAQQPTVENEKTLVLTPKMISAYKMK